MNDTSYQRDTDDYLVRGTAKGGLLKCTAVRSTRVVEEAGKIHELSPLMTVAFGRLLTGGLLMSTDLKADLDQVDLQIRSSGPVQAMTVIAQPGGRVRGTVANPQVEAIYKEDRSFNIGKAVGQGSLTVVRNLGLKEPYVGRVALISGEIADDLAGYYFYSQQLPTILALGVRLGPEGVAAAGGLMVQAMPGVDDKMLDWLEQRAGGLPDISGWLEEGFNPHQLIDLFLGDPDLEYGDSYPVSYHCPCSGRTMTKALLALGKEDLLDLAQDPDGIELVCHFCNRQYKFSQQYLQDLLTNS